MLFHHWRNRRHDLYAEHTHNPRDKKEKLCKRVDQKQWTMRSCLGDKRFAKQLEETALKLKSHLLFEDRITSWIRIVNGDAKYVREAMPIQEGERAAGEPAAKARPILKQASTSNWNFIPIKERRSIDTEVQRSKDRCCFLMPKFITQLLRHKEVDREEDAGVPCDRIVEKWNEVLSKDSRCWSDEVKQESKMAPHWSANKWIDVLSKGGGQKKRFQYCLKPDCPGRLLYFPAIEGRSGKAHSGNAPTNPVLQDNVLLPMNFTKYVYHVGHGNELRSTVRNGLVPGGFSTKTSRCAVFFTVVDPMDDEQGLRETFCDLSQAWIAPYKNIWKHLQIHYFGATYCPLKKEDSNFSTQGQMPSSSMTHCLQS